MEEKTKTLVIEKQEREMHKVKFESKVSKVITQKQAEKQKLSKIKIEPKIKKESEKLFTSSVIERPNYDFIPELPPKEKTEKEVKVEVTYKPDKKATKFRLRLATIIFAVIALTAGVWSTVNIVNITNINQAISEAATEYSINGAKLAAKIHTLDNANRGNEFLETYPEPMQEASDFEPKSNWFSRLCDFLSNLFGG